jgi:hypothetical protein
MVSIIWSKFRSINILYSEIGGHVLTSFFDTYQDGQEKLIGRGEIIIADADEKLV